MSPVFRPLFVAEPPSSYLTRPPLVVDCSVLAAILFEEASRDDALRQLAGKTLHAPDLLDHEIANTAAQKQQQGCPQEVVALALSDYGAQAIELHRTDAAAQYALALRYHLSGYDAAYLWLAAELKAPLATFDEKLGTAAQLHLASLS